jgi:hypothetical protein
VGPGSKGYLDAAMAAEKLTADEHHLLLIAVRYYQDSCATDEEAETLNQIVDKLGLRPQDDSH